MKDIIVNILINWGVQVFFIVVGVIHGKCFVSNDFAIGWFVGCTLFMVGMFAGTENCKALSEIVDIKSLEGVERR